MRFLASLARMALDKGHYIQMGRTAVAEKQLLQRPTHKQEETEKEKAELEADEGRDTGKGGRHSGESTCAWFACHRGYVEQMYRSVL